MKKFTVSLMSLAVLTATTFSTISCDSDSKADDSTKIENNSTTMAARSGNYMSIINEILAEGDLEDIDQAFLNRYLVRFGYNEGDMTVSQFNNLLSQCLSAKSELEGSLTVEKVLTYYKDARMHPYITKLVNGENIDAEIESTAFNALSSSDKEYLIFMNDIIKDYQDSLTSSSSIASTSMAAYGRSQDIPCPSTPCTFGMMFVFGSIGAAAGPWGAVGGAVVGLIIGVAIK